MPPNTRRAVRSASSSVVTASRRSSGAASSSHDLREAVTTLEETTRTARRVFGGAHPLTSSIEDDLREAREALSARETQPPKTFAKG